MHPDNRALTLHHAGWYLQASVVHRVRRNTLQALPAGGRRNLHGCQLASVHQNASHASLPYHPDHSPKICSCSPLCCMVVAGERGASRAAQHLAGAASGRAAESAGLRAGEHAAERVAERVALHAGDSVISHAGEAAAVAAAGHVAGAVGRKRGLAGLLDGLLDKLLSSRLLQRVASPAVSCAP